VVSSALITAASMIPSVIGPRFSAAGLTTVRVARGAVGSLGVPPTTGGLADRVLADCLGAPRPVSSSLNVRPPLGARFLLAAATRECDGAGEQGVRPCAFRLL